MRKNSLLIKLFVFGSLVSILPVVLVGAFSTFKSSKEIQNQNNLAQMQLIQQVKSNIEQVVFVADHTFTNLLESTVMEDALNSGLQANHFQLYNRLRREIINLQSFDTKVGEVILLDKRQNWIILNQGIRRLEAHPSAEELMEFFKLEDVSSWHLLKNSDYKDLPQNASCPYTISEIRKLPHYRKDHSALAFLNIPACSIADMISSGEGSNETMVIDEQQNIIAHRNHELIGTNLLDHPNFDSKVNFTEASGQFSLTQSGEPYTVTYNKSSLNNWTYLSIVSVDQLTLESRQIRWFTLIISLVTIAISMIFVYFISNHIYFPVNRLIQRIHQNKSGSNDKISNELQVIEHYMNDLYSSKSDLETVMHAYHQQVQTLFLSRLYSGSLRIEEIHGKLLQFDWLDRMNRWGSMTVLTLQVDTLDDTHYDMKDLDLLLFAVSNIVDEMVDSKERFPSVWFDQTLVILKGHPHSEVEKLRETDYKLTESVKNAIQKYLHLSVSIGISSSFHHISYAARAYEEGMEALKNRVLLGKSVIVPYFSTQSNLATVIHDYPVQIETEIIEAIKIADEIAARDAIAEWMSLVCNDTLPLNECQGFMMRLLTRFLMLKQEMGISYEQLGFRKSSRYMELFSLHMSEEIEEWFTEKMIIPIIHVLDERREFQFQNLSEQMIDYIHQHVEEDVTLERCAASMNYNASYLSSVFKMETGQLFSVYLADYRQQLAKTWLKNTEMTIKEIAERLRYSNSQNFIRSFRKIEGITPGQYRSQYHNQ